MFYQQHGNRHFCQVIFLFVTVLAGLGACNQPAPPAKNIKDSMNAALHAPAFHRPQAAGFTASGTEPFWSLDVYFDSLMVFKTAGGEEIMTPVSKGVKAMDADVIRYSGTHREETLIVQIARLECVNDMSGQKSDYQVTVDAKAEGDKEFRIYKGCGTYKKEKAN